MNQKTVREFIKNHPGFLILCFLLMGIGITTVKPDLYLMGWDNYSSYFNLPTNIFRTFFAAWRDHRGFGVPSDSEVVDLFRQLFFLLLSPFFRRELWDQFYYLLCLVGGVLGMYFFVRRILIHSIHHTNRILSDAAAGAAGLFYLCNLNTLATFYFPIVTFNTRFLALPYVFIILHRLAEQRPVHTKVFLLVGASLLFFSGSSITATVFITTMLALGVYALFLPKSIRLIGAFFLLIGSQCFWMFPFANYIIQKGPITNLAPAFVDTNESLKNKPDSYFSPLRQLILTPSFFETTYLDTNTNSNTLFHPLATEMKNGPTGIAVYLFPLLYIAGSLIIVFQWKKYTIFRFAPVILGIFIFLSLKEYSPLGFVYHWLDTYIPYFGVIFRFGDTKFHTYIAFAGAVCVSVVVLELASRFHVRKSHIRRIGTTLVIFGLFGIVVYPFRFYLQGALIGPFMYNKIPSAYTDMASIINSDKRYVRVLHLPYDERAYWRSYAWGELGSSFFHYMIHKPLFEKTFEPGSMENAGFDARISTVLTGVSSLADAQSVRTRAHELLSYLNQAGVGYVIVDGSIRAGVPARDSVYWGKFPYFEAKTLLESLAAEGLVRVAGTYPMTLDLYWSTYANNGLVRVGKHTQDVSEEVTITLYTIPSPDAPVTSLSHPTPVDPMTMDFEPANRFTQTVDGSGTRPFTVQPFLRRDAAITTDENGIGYTFPVRMSGSYVASAQGKGIAVDVTATATKDAIHVFLTPVYTPAINGNSYQSPASEFIILSGKIGKAIDDSIPYRSFAGDWWVMGNSVAGPLRLEIDGVVLPIPKTLTEQPTSLGTVLAKTDKPLVRALQVSKISPVPQSKIQKTDTPNCLGDALPGYTHSFEGASGTVTTEKGTTCLVGSLESAIVKGSEYIETSLTVEGTSKDLDGTVPDISQNALYKIVKDTQKPVFLSYCLSVGGHFDLCQNKHTVLTVGEKQTIRIPTDAGIENVQAPILLLAVKTNGYQKATATMTGMNVYSFSPIVSASVPLAPNTPKPVALNGPSLQMTIPYIFSHGSFFARIGFDGFDTSNAPCTKGAYRTFRVVGVNLVSSESGCYTEQFVTAPFDASSFLLWTQAYHLFAGKYPRGFIKDTYTTYVDEYLSFFQGYPTITGFREFPRLGSESKTKVLNAFGSGALVTSYLLFPPKDGVNDGRQKQFVIHQDSENAGAVSYGDSYIVDMPASWYAFSITPTEQPESYVRPATLSYRQILPSLWNITASGEGEALLKLNVGYDTQWHAYRSLTDMLLGIHPLPHNTCDGYANCFTATLRSIGQTYWVFYIPETLSFLGWAATIAVFVFSARFFARSRI
jgi:hypothetical protein